MKEEENKFSFSRSKLVSLAGVLEKNEKKNKTTSVYRLKKTRGHEQASLEDTAMIFSTKFCIFLS